MRALLLAFALPTITFAADDFRAADRTLEARSILIKHCSACHGENAQDPKLSVVNYPSLIKPRPVFTIQPRDAAASQLLTLVEEGSMPPGNLPKLTVEETKLLRDWITEGAGEYPAKFNDEFAWKVISEDVTKISPKELPNVRYLTLHHRVNEAEKFPATRSESLTRFRRFIRNGAKWPESVDPAGTVFRVNLKEVGWDHQPFAIVDQANMIKRDEPVKANLFDLVLLDYPFARFPVGTAIGDSLAKNYLNNAGLVRPVPFVHMDWFSHLLTNSVLGKDVATLLKTKELPMPGFEDKSSVAPPKPQGNESHQLPAIDSWTKEDPVLAKPSAIEGLEFWLMNSKTGQKTNQFKPGDQVKIHLKADVPIYYEVLWVDSKLGLNAWSKNVEALLPNKVLEEDFSGELDETAGKERLTLFVSTHNFTKGRAWRSEGNQAQGVDRFVHSLYLLQNSDGKFVFQSATTNVERRTIEIEILKK